MQVFFVCCFSNHSTHEERCSISYGTVQIFFFFFCKKGPTQEGSNPLPPGLHFLLHIFLPSEL